MKGFLPEGSLIHKAENQSAVRSLTALRDACASQTILEAKAVVCDHHHNLIVDLGFCRGFIPRAEGALGIAEGKTRDIALISRVNKPVCFTVKDPDACMGGEPFPLLSRSQAQQLCTENYISKLKPGDIIPGRVTHLEPFGCFVDIGCGIPSLIPIDQISVSRISHPADRFSVGDDIFAAVKSLAPDGRICLTHKELLGTWQENADLFSPGETVAGIIRSVEDYGIFVELSPNLAGLAEPFPGASVGQHAGVYIKSIIPDKMKIKLVIVDCFSCADAPVHLKYFRSQGHISHWKYSTDASERLIETVFE